MIVRFRRGNMAETRPVHGKLDHHVSAGRKRDGYKQLPVSVEFPKYGNTLFRAKVPRDWENLLVISRACYIENLDFTNFWQNKQTVHYIDV